MDDNLIAYISSQVAYYLEQQIAQEPDFLNNAYHRTSYILYPGISQDEITRLRGMAAFERQSLLKGIVSANFNEDKSELEEKWRWIVGTWGGIKKFDVSKRINELYDEKLKYKGDINLYLEDKTCSLQSISSFSKIASFTKPCEWFVYDSRVTYVLNWLLYKYENIQDIRFFRIPNSYSDRRGALSKRIGTGLLYYNNCYGTYCEIIKEVAKRFPWGEFSITEKHPCKIEMILFALGKNGGIIDSEIRQIEQDVEVHGNEISPSQAVNKNCTQNVFLTVYRPGKTFFVHNNINGSNVQGVCVVYDGKEYSATLGAYKAKTLRKAGCIDKFIEDHHLTPGQRVPCRFVNENGIHKYIVTDILCKRL